MAVDLHQGRFRPGSPIDAYTREMIYNIFSRLQKSNPQETITESIRKTSLFVGVSVRTVQKIRTEKRKYGSFRTPGLTRPGSLGKRNRLARYGQSVYTALRAKTNTYFIETKNPTIGKLLEEINNDKSILYNDKSTTLSRLMKDLGIRFQRVKNSGVVIQQTEQSLQNAEESSDPDDFDPPS